MELKVEIAEFDDGHTPALSQNKGKSTLLAYNRHRASSKFVSVYDDLLPAPWPVRMYDYAAKRGRPWGAYVQTKDLLAFEQSGQAAWSKMLAFVESIWEVEPERAFATCATYSLVMQRARGLIGKDLEHIHGTAVWCLGSGVTNSVEYHIDYAELYRYETNVIHPPLYAGTVQVTPLGAGAMEGGDFCVNTGGIAHYAKFGYKAKLMGTQALEADLASSCDWHTVRYKTNRGILHDGDLPHLSTPVVSLPQGTLRVILGFNCFTSEVGECCIRAPEHSQAFNRTVKLYQAMAAVTGGPVPAPASGKYDKSESTPSSAAAVAGSVGVIQAPKAQLSAKEILKNPALAKLLVLAARKVKEKEKEEAAAAAAAGSVFSPL